MISAERVGSVLLAAIVFLLPLEVSKLLFPVEWLELSRLVMAVTILLLPILLARHGWRPIPRSLLVTGGIVLAVDATSVLATRWPNGVRELAAVAVYALFAVFVSQVVRGSAELRRQSAALLASGTYVAAVLAVQEALGFYLWRGDLAAAIDRRNATFSDPNITARFLNLVLGVALAALALVRASATRLLLLGYVALSAVGLVLTFSRWGWGTAVLLVAALVPFAVANRRVRTGIAVFAVAFVVALGVIPHALSRAIDVVGAVTGGGGGENPADIGAAVQPGPGQPRTFLDPVILRIPLDTERRYLLRAAAAMFEDRPLVGVGLGGFQPMILGPYFEYVPPARRASPTSLPHTELAKTAAETGMVGLAALTAFVLAVVVELRRLARTSGAWSRIAAVGLMAAFAVIILGSQGEGRFWTEPYLWLVVGTIAGLAGGLPRSGLEQ